MVEEKIVTIPLRRELLKVPRYKRVGKAVKSVRKYMERRVKSGEIILGQALNLKLHERGRQNPPTSIKVKMYKFKEKTVVDLVDAPLLKEEDKKEKKGKEVSQKKEEIHAKKEETIEEEKKKALEKPLREKKVAQAPHEAQPKEKKAGQQEMKKEIFSKTQKPKHEKKK